MELTGHTNLVTNFSLRSFETNSSTQPSDEAVSTRPIPGQAKDIIVSVSDDFTAKVFCLDVSVLAD